MLRHSLIYAAALALGVSASQLPEFAQQYRQRLGGAIVELGHVVDEFDRDASSAGLTRTQALDMHDKATEPLFQARGRSMRASIARYDTLVQQQKDFGETSPLMQPLVLGHSDPTTLSGAWQDFRPAVPMTAAGLTWAAFGYLLGAGLLYLLSSLTRRAWRGRQPARAEIR